MMSLRIAAPLLFALFAATSAFAQQGTQDFANQILSTRDRDGVRAELAQERRAGQLENRGQSYSSFARSEPVSTSKRMQARADVARSQAFGAQTTRRDQAAR
jgi:Domain of unknown function (DUF4148)